MGVSNDNGRGAMTPEIRITNVVTVRIENTPANETCQQVYRALLKTGAKTAQELEQHMGMSRSAVVVMLAYLVSLDIVTLETDEMVQELMRIDERMRDEEWR